MGELTLNRTEVARALVKRFTRTDPETGENHYTLETLDEMTRDFYLKVADVACADVRRQNG